MTDNWVRTWGAAPRATEALGSPADVPPRQVVRISGGGRRLRVRFTNEYGTAPRTIGAARVGLATGGDRELTFAGRPSAVVPAGAPILSDPVDLSLPPLAELTIGLDRPVPVSAVEVVPDGPAGTIVVIGDSLTEGFGSTPDANRRWPDRLAERLGGHVSNQGISGNRLLNDGHGVSALARFDRDVLATPGLGHVVLAEGLGDIGVSFAPRGGALDDFLSMFPGEPVTADDIIAGYRQLIARAHGHGVPIYAATLTPYGNDDMFAPAGEIARQVVNAWIRTGGAFDGVLDFDAVWRDPDRPSRIRDGFHVGDVHGNDAGYRALGDSIDLTLFKETSHA